MAPAGQKRFRRELRSDVWPQVGYRLTTPRDRYPLATGDAIDDVAAVVAQLADGYFAHAGSVSRVRQGARGGWAGKVPNRTLDDPHPSRVVGQWGPLGATDATISCWELARLLYQPADGQGLGDGFVDRHRLARVEQGVEPRRAERRVGRIRVWALAGRG